MAIIREMDPDRTEDNDQEDADRKPGASRRFKVLSVLAVLGIVLLWIAQRHIASSIDGRIREHLETRGWSYQRKGSSWGPLRGLILTRVAIGPVGKAAAIELDSLQIRFPLRRAWGGRGGAIRVGSPRGKLVLRDSRGEIHLQRTSFEIESRGQELVVKKLSTRHGNLTAELEGILRLAGNSPGSLSKWQPDFDVVRGTLAALDIKGERNLFKVTGRFEVDARSEPVAWNAKLSGSGEEIRWQDISFSRATSEAFLSEGASEITTRLAVASGEMEFRVEKDDWEASPFAFTGKISDPANRSNEFHGSYRPGEGIWTLKRMKGAADLWAIARGIPEFSSRLPRNLSIEVFPGIDLRDVTRVPGEEWQVGTLLLTSAAEMTVTTDKGREVKVGGLRGNAYRSKDAWVIRSATASLLGGELSGRGIYTDLKLRDANLVAKGMELAAIKAAAGRKSAGKGVLSLHYKGEVDLKSKSLEGRGSLELQNAPVIEIPLLDQTYDLFTSMIPELKRADTGQFNATFVCKEEAVEVPRFLASGGTLTVSAKGRVDLEKRRVDGVARGKLSGLPGLLTKPLSRLLEMEVGGPFDDIRVKPLGPAKLVSNAVSGTVGVPVETLEEAGKVTATVIAEGIKLPFQWLGKEESPPQEKGEVKRSERH